MIPTLTNRQISVLAMAADGYDAQQIAAYLYLSCRDVRRIMSDCLSRLEVTTLREAAECARQLGLIGTGRVVA